MIKILCDRCNAEIGEHENVGYIAVSAEIGEMSDNNVTMRNAEFADHVFCRSCTENIKDFICNPEPKLRAKIKPKLTESGKKRQRRKIDTGNIMALHNAGWSNGKIGDEPDIDMTDSEVGQAIRRYKRKMMEKGNNQGG